MHYLKLYQKDFSNIRKYVQKKCSIPLGEDSNYYFILKERKLKIRFTVPAMIIAVCFLCSCVARQETSSQPVESTMTPIAMPFESPSPSPKPTLPPHPDVRIKSHRIEKYVQGQYSIEYPVFEGENCERLNSFVYDKIYERANENLYESIGGEPIGNLQTEVTFTGKYVVSIIFWGESYYNVSMHPGDMLMTLNVDLSSMEEVPISALYKVTDKQFPVLFSQYAHFPSGTVTSYTADRFEELMEYNFRPTEESVPDLPENSGYFLTPDGCVFSYLSIHVFGHDHFEAQMDYDVLEPLYLGPDGYFEEAKSS